MTICIQCALEAYVASEGKVDMTKEARFDESPEEHTKRCHPDLLATRARRRELEREFARIHGGTMIYPEDN